MNASKFSLDPLKATESTSDALSEWENATLRVLQNEGSKDVQYLFTKVSGVLGGLGLALNDNTFAQMIEDMIKKGKLSVAQAGTDPTQFKVSLPKPT